MTQFNAVPRAPLFLGAAGLLPPLGCLTVLLLGPAAWREPAFHLAALYAASILSFLGGAWWGLSCAKAAENALSELLILSVVPSLAACAAVFILSPSSLILLAVLFIACLAMDRRLLKAGLTPPWWFSLRLPLSVGMALLNFLIALEF